MKISEKIKDHPLYIDGLSRATDDNEKRRVEQAAISAAAELDRSLKALSELVETFKKATMVRAVDEDEK